MFNWVLQAKLETELGMTPKEVASRRDRGHWVQGVHFKKFADGRYWYSVNAIREWQEQQAKSAA